jgi:hypothetical protein
MNQVSALFWFFDAMGNAAFFGAGIVLGLIVGFILAGAYFRRKKCEVSGQ